MSSDTGATVEIFDIFCHGLSVNKGEKFKRTPSYYLQIAVEQNTQKTLVVKYDGDPSWTGPISFPVTSTGSMMIHVYLKHTVRRNVLLGELQAPLITTAIDGANDPQGVEINQQLFKAHKKAERTAIGVSIRFRLRCLKPKPAGTIQSKMEDTIGSERLMVPEDPKKTVDIKDAAKIDVPAPSNATGSEDAQKLEAVVFEAKEKSKNISSTPKVAKVAQDVVDGVEKTAKTAKNIYSLWKPLSQKVSTFVKIVDAIVEIHPYAKIAWAVLSQPVKIMLEQVKLDQDIEALLEKMIEIYEMILLAEPLKIEAHCDVVSLMCQQTTECALFISEYSSHVFAKRMVASFISGHSDKAKAYQDAFEKLKAKFLGQTAIVTQLVVFQMSAKTDEMLSILKEIYITQELDRLPRASNQRQHSGCDAGTRKAIIEKIITWLTQPVDNNVERFFWLHGVAGCGKSAIAQSVSDQLLTQRRCVSFFFNASTQTKAGLDCLYATLSRDLARLNDDWKAALVKAIRSSTKEPGELPLKAQLETFLLKPASEVTSIGPILIVIDALDESGPLKQRSPLLQTLTRLTELPIQFRFLITSRPESDISDAFRNKDWVKLSQLDRVDEPFVNDDIRLFVRARLQQIRELKERWDDRWVDQIVLQSDKLFQWAFTACEYIVGDGTIGLNPLKRLEELLKSKAYTGLDALYLAILNHLCNFQPGDVTSRIFQAIMGRMLSVQEPLSIDTLSALWSNKEDENQVHSILSPLGSLLRGVSGRNEPIQPLHASFIDFLTTKERSGRYWIDLQRQNEILSQTCLREMKELLHFNICGLETSYVLNHDVSDLDSRLEQRIPPHLSYACRFWVDHLRAFTPTDEWYGPIQVFMQRYLLFWLEALSLLGRVDRALAQLSMLKDWLQSMDNCEELKQLVSDSLRFVEVTAPVLRQSTPHLYLSALPFVPRDSALSKLYLPAFPGSIDVEESDSIRWSSMLLSINASSKLWSIALSPDGKRIVSGSENKIWSIWDAETGNLLIGPISGHTGEIYSVAFSLDGKRVASGSNDNTVSIWDAETGEQVTEPLVSHTDGVLSVAFSPDGRHIASGSFDKTIKIWDCKTGANIKTLDNGHNDFIRSIAYSSDSKYIASGSADHKVIIWNCETGDPTILSDHSDIVTHVAFSHDGKQLVSSSDDKTIIVWSTETGKRVLDPLTGHTGPVPCIAGALIAGPFEGHGNTIVSVMFSPDGKHVISGSADETIKIWDIDAGRGRMVHTLPLPRGTAPCVCGTRLQASQRASHSEAIPMASIQSRFRPTESKSSRALIGYSDAHTDTISCIASSPDGGRVVSGSLDGTVRVWDAETAVLVAGPFVEQAGRVSAVAFSSDGKRVVSSSNDAAVKIWDIELGECVVEPFVGDAGQVSTVAFSPNGTMVILAFKDGSLRVCDVLTSELLMELTNISAVTSIAMSADGGLLASGSSDKTVRVWDVSTGESIAEPFVHDDVVEAVALSPDGRYVISSSSDGWLRVWDVKTGAVIRKRFCGPSISIAFSPDGTRIVTGLADKRVLVWDLEKHNATMRLLGHQNSVHSAVFSADGRRIFSGSADRSLKIWDSQTGNLLAETPTTHSDIVFSVAFSSDGKRVASGSLDKSVRIWDAKTGRLIGRPLLGHTDEVNCVVFPPDSKYIASGSSDKTIRIWDTWTSKEVAQLLNDQQSTRLAFSPDGTLLVSGLGYGDIKLWDTTTWDGKATPGQFQGHTRLISFIRFSSDGRRVISSSLDKTVRIWDINTGKCIAGPFRHNDDVFSAALSFDSSHFISGSQDNTVKIWNIDFGARDNSEQETSNTDHTLISGKPHSHLENFTDSSKFEDGWMRGPNNELLFWIPPDYRSSIWRPSNIALIGRIVMRLKLDRFTHGTNWAKCIDETRFVRAFPDSE